LIEHSIERAGVYPIGVSVDPIGLAIPSHGGGNERIEGPKRARQRLVRDWWMLE
jgi:hypothetical protein